MYHSQFKLLKDPSRESGRISGLVCFRVGVSCLIHSNNFGRLLLQICVNGPEVTISFDSAYRVNVLGYVGVIEHVGGRS